MLRTRFPAAVLASLAAGFLSARAYAAEPAKTAVEGRQLRLELSASKANVGPGQRVALTLDISLKPNMHVYAPGVEGYIAIEWKMRDSAAVPGDVTFPASEKLYLKAIDETVPVYRGEFRLTRDLVIGQDGKAKPPVDAAGQFTVEGTLRYQACDDRLCYIPQELPLKWTFRYQSAAVK
jgi:DsbC/DsbD-like thiol-disulfide interchange protein